MILRHFNIDILKNLAGCVKINNGDGVYMVQCLALKLDFDRVFSLKTIYFQKVEIFFYRLK